MTARIGTYPVGRDDTLVGPLAAASDRLRTKLLDLDSAALGLSDYSRRYLEGTLVNGVSKLNMYAYLLLLAFDGTEEPGLPALGVVDHGGGNGLLSLLAREAGIGTVVYTDIIEESSQDARRLGAALGLEADAYVVGELDDLKEHLGASDVRIDAICSYDVIEHIYDIDAFLRAVPSMTTSTLR